MNERSRYPDVGYIRTNNYVVGRIVASGEVFWSLASRDRVVLVNRIYCPPDGRPVVRFGDDVSLRIIGQNMASCFLYATPERFGARAIVLYYRLKRRVWRTSYLLVRLAEIWGLAEVDPAMIPNWRDLLIVRRFRK